MNQVFVLFNGYSYFENHQDPPIMKANSSCVLIKGKNDCNVIIDTMTAWDADLLLSELKNHHITPDEVHYVVSTHGHSDHIGNNNLFLNATHFVGTCISKKHYYFVHDFEKESFKINEDIEVIATKGHTSTCVSVIVRNSNFLDENMKLETVGISGDLFEKEEDIEDARLWIEAGSEHVEEQRKNRLLLANRVDYIIPGHGPIFKLTDEMRQKLERDCKEN